MNDFNTSPKMLSLMNSPLKTRKISSKSKLSKSKLSKSKTKSKKSLFTNYSYPLLNSIKVPKIDMKKLIPYQLMNSNLKSKSTKSKSKYIQKSIPRYTYKSKSKSKTKTRSKFTPKSKSLNFMTNNTNSFRNLLSPIRSPTRTSSQIIRRATPYVRNTASKISSFIPETQYQSLTKPIQTLSQPQQLYPLRENNDNKIL
jgi:hypothetical protein